MQIKQLILGMTLVFFSSLTVAEKSNMTVDQADKLDTNAFHENTSKQEAIIRKDFKEPWEPGDTDAVNAYDMPKEKGGVNAYDSKSASTPAAKSAMTTTAAVLPETFGKGQRVNIRERYTLNGKPSAMDAGNALQAQMIGFCPKGFAKHGEWVKPETGTKDFYLYYQFECIE